MKRRAFLGAAAAGAAMIPLARRLAFGDITAGGGTRRGPGLSKPAPGEAPLVVLVIPQTDEAKYERGHAFGEWLQHGRPDQLAPLAVARVACAEMAEVRKLATGVPAGEPWIVVVNDDGRAEALEGALPPRPRAMRGEGDEKGEERVIAGRIAALAKILWSSKVLTARMKTRDVSWAAAGAEVQRRVRAVPPPGSHWARDSMCGYETVENMKPAPGDEMIGVDCGMGHVPAKSARFLYFWTQTPETRARLRSAKEKT
jgi:hypothetical protein